MDIEDIILEQELLTNQRKVYHSKFGDLILKRPNPAVEAKIGEERRRIYHQDLKDDSVLTTKEVEKLLHKRGIWSKEDSQRMQELASKSGEMISRLDATGFETPTQFYTELLECHGDLSDAYAEDAKLLELVGKIFNLDKELDPKWLKKLRDNAGSTEVTDLLDKASNIRKQSELLRDFGEIKAELSDLSETHSQFFGDTIEARAARTERMARIYYCVTTEDGKPLWPKFADMWQEDPQVIAWLGMQLYYFENGITEEYAKVLQSHGFMERVIDTGASSEDSPDRPTSNSGGESEEKQPKDSSESEVPITT